MIHKKGSRQDLKNYRQIVLLSIIGKILESVITDELVRYLESTAVLDDSQHGFRAKCGCHSALLAM